MSLDSEIKQLNNQISVNANILSELMESEEYHRQNIDTINNIYKMKKIIQKLYEKKDELL